MGRSTHSATSSLSSRCVLPPTPSKGVARRLGLFLAAALAVLFASCDTESDPFSVSSLHEDGWRLVVEPADVSMDLGASMGLSAYLENDEGRRRTLSSVGLEVDWISENPSVAEIEEGGLLRAVAPGRAEVDAQVRTREADLSGEASVRVSVPPSQVRVENDDSLTGSVGAPLPDEVVVRVLGPNNRAAGGVRVRFEVEGEGAVSPSAAWTDEDGEARTNWVLGPEAGEQTLHVSAQSGTVVGSSGNGRSAEVEVTATALPGDPAQIAVTPTYLSLVPDSAASLTAEVRDGFGNRIPDAPMAWGITKPWVASIDSDGSVEAAHEGVALITASSGELETRATVVVSPADVSLELQKTAGDDQSGTVDQALAEPTRVRVTHADGSPAADVEVVWNVTAGGGWTSATTTSTDSDGYAQVDWTLGTAAGSQRLTASASGVGTVTFDAFADPGTPREVVITPSTLVLTTGETGQLAAEVRDEFGNAVPNSSVDWQSMDPAVASISPTGQVTGQSIGNATVGASHDNLEGWSLVKVESGEPPSGGGDGGGDDGSDSGDGSGGGDTGGELSLLRAAGNGQTGTVGEPLNDGLRVRLTDDTGTGVEGETVSWSVTSGGGSLSASSTTTDGSGYAQVNWTLGTTAGSQDVSATVAGTGSVAFTATAEPGPVSQVEVSPSSLSLEVGTVAQLEATASDSYGNDVSDASEAWSSSDTGVATVSADGSVEAVASGSATVTVTVADLSVDVPVEVLSSSDSDDSTASPEAVDDLSVVATSDSSVTLEWTQVDDGTGSPADYAIRYGSPTITWGDAYETEVSVTGDAVGATIQYEYTGLASGTDFEFQLVPYRGTLNETGVDFGPVSNAVAATTDATDDGGDEVASIELSESSLSFTALEDEALLSATALDGSGTALDGVTVDWTSSDEEVATVDTDGRVIAKGTGTALVIASALCCTAADTAEVDVTQEVASVEVSPASISLSPDESQALSASALDANGFDVSSAGTVVWASSNEAVATVDAETGVVTAVDTGGATISATTESITGESTISVVEESVDDVLFSDDFESGSRSSPVWANSSPNVTVSTDNPRNGSYSLKFHYNAKPDGEDATAIQHFDLGGEYTEVWIEYDFYLPDNFYHREQSGPENNKFFRLWDGSATTGDSDVLAGASFSRSRDGTSGESRMYVQWRGYDDPVYTGQDRDQGSQEDPFFLISSDNPNGIQRGSWAQIRWHIRLSSSDGVDDGVIRLYVNGQKVAYRENIDYHGAPGNSFFSYGYLMGWANSGYDEDMDFYIDNFRVQTSDPGW